MGVLPIEGELETGPEAEAFCSTGTRESAPMDNTKSLYEVFNWYYYREFL
jgi:hypothetical protein